MTFRRSICGHRSLLIGISIERNMLLMGVKTDGLTRFSRFCCQSRSPCPRMGDPEGLQEKFCTEDLLILISTAKMRNIE
jgi:hypothetical protein